MRGSWEGEDDPLAALSAGDVGPFEEFVRTEVATFLGFFARLGADAQEAEDLTQEVFLKLFQHARRYRQSERFAAFAFRVARNAFLDRTRRRAARGSVAPAGRPAEDGAAAAELLPAPGADAAGSSATRDEARALLAALGELSEGHRAVFELGAMQQLGYDEVADLLGIPVGTVKSRMFHAVRRLRAALQPDPVRPDAEGGP